MDGMDEMDNALVLSSVSGVSRFSFASSCLRVRQLREDHRRDARTPQSHARLVIIT